MSEAGQVGHPEQVEIVETSKGMPMALCGGYKYRKKKILKNTSIFWVCNAKQCKGTLTTHSGYLYIKENNNHSCVPNVAAQTVEKCLFQCKKRAREETTALSKIFDEELSAVKDAGLDFVTEIPLFVSKKASLYRNRNRALGFSSFKSSTDITLSSELVHDFLLIDDDVAGDRILAFANETRRECLKQANDFFSDGTFKSCCKQFHQLYTIHCDLGSTQESTNIILVLYALLPDRREETYSRLFSALEKVVPEFQPKSFKIDFERSMINTLKKHFPNTILKGCNFHFNQSLWRKVQNLGLVQKYKTEIDVRRHVKMCAALSHLPPEKIIDGWLFIMESAPVDTALEQFNDYFVGQWLENDAIGTMWNCYKEKHRTTNPLESWHSKLNRRLGRVTPNVCQLVSALKEDAKHNTFLRNRLQINMTPNKRRKLYSNQDSAIGKTITELEQNKVSLGRTMEILQRVVQFV